MTDDINTAEAVTPSEAPPADQVRVEVEKLFWKKPVLKMLPISDDAESKTLFSIEVGFGISPPGPVS